MIDGILNIHKATGMTSHDVVARIRKLLHQRRVGHAGTLDPAASGVLPICVGQATRVAEYLSESGKAYTATITFGVVTDTYDAEGEIVRITDAASLSPSQVEDALPHFIGKQMQSPPHYSAIKVQGQPAYRRVRAGEEITLAARAIEIFNLQLLEWYPGAQPRITLAVECSKGTYIRSLAYDLGEQLGCGAHLSALIRTRSGPFSLEEAVTLEAVAEVATQGTIEQLLLPADRVLQDYPAFYLNAQTTAYVLHGNAFQIEGNTSSHAPAIGLARVYDDKGQFLAIATWNEQQGMWQPKKVFNQ